MQAFKGIIKNGKVILPEGADLPEGAVVTVTIGEAEYVKAKLRLALKRPVARPTRVRLGDLQSESI